MSPDEDAIKAAEEHVAMTLGMIEGVTTLADSAKSMKDALEQRGFAPAVADQAGIQFMFTMLTMSTSYPPSKGGR